MIGDFGTKRAPEQLHGLGDPASISSEVRAGGPTFLFAFCLTINICSESLTAGCLPVKRMCKVVESAVIQPLELILDMPLSG
jgi:hypothetical protein